MLPRANNASATLSPSLIKNETTASKNPSLSSYIRHCCRDQAAVEDDGSLSLSTFPAEHSHAAETKGVLKNLLFLRGEVEAINNSFMNDSTTEAPSESSVLLPPEGESGYSF